MDVRALARIVFSGPATNAHRTKFVAVWTSKFLFIFGLSTISTRLVTPAASRLLAPSFRLSPISLGLLTLEYSCSFLDLKDRKRRVRITSRAGGPQSSPTFPGVHEAT